MLFVNHTRRSRSLGDLGAFFVVVVRVHQVPLCNVELDLVIALPPIASTCDLNGSQLMQDFHVANFTE